MMREGKWSESQIFGIFKEAENGVPVVELRRKHSVGESAFYRWRSKYCGIEASDTRRLKELEEENRQLKQMYADLSLKHQMLDELVKNKDVKSTQRRQWVDFFIETFGASISKAC